jgi:hypothetical protein
LTLGAPPWARPMPSTANTFSLKNGKFAATSASTMTNQLENATSIVSFNIERKNEFQKQKIESAAPEVQRSRF